MEIRQQVTEEIREIELKNALTTESILQEIYDFCKKQAEEAAKLAATSRDREAASRCFLPVTNILSKMTQPRNERNESESDGYIEAIRATAENDWKDARPVQMGTSEQKAEDGS